MTEEYYNKNYKDKTTKQLCNQWRKYYTEAFKKWGDEKTVEYIKTIKDNEIVNLALAEYLEDIKNDKTN